VAQIVAAAGKVPVQLGGGLREEAHIRQALDAGVSRVILGTRALRDAEWAGNITRAHPRKVVLGLDAREGRVAAQGWLETDSLTVAEVLDRAKDWPLAAIVFTDIGRDGTLKGCNVEATAEVARLASVEVIASGGIGSLEDILAVAKAGLPGCIVGRALYDGRVDLKHAITAVAKG